MGTTRSSNLFRILAMSVAVSAMAACGGGSSSPPDADGDGVPDAMDAFPNDASESRDSDGDGVGDNGDAFPNDSNETADDDGDGVGNNGDNCPMDANEDQADSDADGAGDACDPVATTYTFPSAFDSGDSVSYTGQTTRHMLMLGLVRASAGLTERPGEEAEVRAELQFFMTGEGANETPHGFTVSGGEPVIPGPNYGDISANKTLTGKIAGGDGAGGGETSRLIDDDFFGWQDGMDDTPLPIELVNFYIDRLAAEATDGVTPSVSTTADPAVSIGTASVDAVGRDYRQLLQKFLSGAVSLSQGTNDYFQNNWPNSLAQEGDKNYTAAEHDFDEAFGYYGAARNQNEYTDDEAAAKGGREGWGGGYHDSDGDGSIDVRSEVVLGHAQNCAKRDRGSDGATNFSKEAMDAFLLGRQILSNASIAGAITDEALEALRGQIQIAAKVWEQCVAATVVHYINDVTSDMGDFEGTSFADLDNFLNLAKHWGEMKGFALALQFSPFSPFRDGSVADIDLDDLRQALSLMGDAPVLADGSQNGMPPSGTPQEAVAGYIADLATARDILQQAYEFDPEVVAGW
ncbi:MAG: DUF4856 domain-containing protein [Gammaproteobacteria bacterium]|nr:DUF4856 domain-containing protein [Gammaproteobacteria bacterium]